MEQENNMTREEAAQVLRNLMDAVSFYDVYDWHDAENAFDVALDALRGPEWVRTADRLPTIDDARYDGYVLVANKNRHYGVRYWSYLEDEIETCPYWMPLPKLPEVEG
jgi:hypothetical protein